MQALWGVIIGSIATLIGTTIIPWIRDTAGAKKRETKARREAIADAILDVINAASDSLLDNDRGSTTMLSRREHASARLGLLLTTSERKVAEAVYIAMIEFINLEGAKAEALTALSDGLPKWYRGEMSPDELHTQILDDVRAGRGEDKAV